MKEHEAIAIEDSLNELRDKLADMTNERDEARNSLAHEVKRLKVAERKLRQCSCVVDALCELLRSKGINPDGYALLKSDIETFLSEA